MRSAVISHALWIIAWAILAVCWSAPLRAADKDAKPADGQLQAPDGTPEELTEFIEQVRSRQPRASSNDELKAFIGQTRPAIVVAADKIRGAKDASDEQRRGAALAKIEALALLTLADAAGSADALEKFAAELLKAGEEMLAETARMQRLEALVLGVQLMDESDQARRYTEIKQAFAAGPADRQHMGVAMQAIRVFESLQLNELAAQAYGDFAAIFLKSDDEAVREAAQRFERSAQRLSLPGKAFVAFTGADTAGRAFDIAQHKGKVVLVDFWATWCGPCVAELPNVKSSYEKYHDRGFEVVGISLDDDLGTLNRFLEENEIPWVTLLHTESQAGAEKISVADYYGVSAIPTVILLGRDGKVVSLDARGEELIRLLEEQFPEDAARTGGGR